MTSETDLKKIAKLAAEYRGRIQHEDMGRDDYAKRVYGLYCVTDEGGLEFRFIWQPWDGRLHVKFDTSAHGDPQEYYVNRTARWSREKAEAYGMDLIAEHAARCALEHENVELGDALAPRPL